MEMIDGWLMVFSLMVVVMLVSLILCLISCLLYSMLLYIMMWLLCGDVNVVLGGIDFLLLVGVLVFMLFVD